MACQKRIGSSGGSSARSGVWIFGPALVGRSTFAFRDAAHYYHPLFEYERQEWGAGRPPLWNPWENAGVPLVGETTSSVFYPGKLIFALPGDFTRLWNLYVIGHVLIAAAGAYYLARRLGAGLPAAGLAALVYAFSGTVLFQHANVVFLVGAAWLPWSLLLVEFMFRRPQPAGGGRAGSRLGPDGHGRRPADGLQLGAGGRTLRGHPLALGPPRPAQS